MPFISVSDGITKKSFTNVENKFMTKYLPVLEPTAVKIYLYALYILQNGLTSYTETDFAKSLNLPEEQIISCFEYLEEFELVSITCRSPLEVQILEVENVYGTPKKFKPEKFSDFTKNAQAVLSGRMISTNEYQRYFYFMEEDGFDQNAMIMILNYCVNMKGNAISYAYIKKVIESFADEGATTAKKVEQKLSAYTSSTPALIKIFNAVGINARPSLEDDKFYKKWTKDFGFEESSIIVAAKLFKVKNCEKLDAALCELYKNRRFDAKEIEDFCKNKNSIYNLTLDIAKNLGVYIQNPAPYVENYINIWYNYGYSFDCLKNLSVYCFRKVKNSFEAMDQFIKELYSEGIISDESVLEYTQKQLSDEKLIKDLLDICGLTRKINRWDRESLIKWRNWGFSDEMLIEAAKRSSDKSNPMAYINGILASWKTEEIFSLDNIPTSISSTKKTTKRKNESNLIEQWQSTLDMLNKTKRNEEN